jgi:hypothetical protein
MTERFSALQLFLAVDNLSKKLIVGTETYQYTLEELN